MRVVRSPFRLSFIVAICLAMLLPSLIQVANAQPLCLGDTVWDAEAEACVNADGTPTTDEVPADDPVTQPTMEATEAGNAELTAPSETMRIGFYYIYCDGTEDLRAKATANPEMYHLCEGRTVNQVLNGYAAYEGSHWGTFSLSAVNPKGTPGYGGGLQNVPRGRWTITADTAAGYAVAPVTVCYQQNVVPAQAVTKGPNIIPYVDPATGAFDLPANADQSDVVCWVHYVPTELGASIDIVVYFCPADIENFHFRSNDSRRLACDEPVQDIGFFTKEHYSDPQTVTVTGGDRVASFPAVQNGVTTINGSGMFGYEPAVVYCELRKPDGDLLMPYRYVAPREPNTIVYDILTPTGKLYCDWFLLPTGAGGTDPLALTGGATPDAVAEGEASSAVPTLTVQRWDCPRLVTGDDYGALLADCTAATDTGDLTVSSDAGETTVPVESGALMAPLPASGPVTVSGEQPLAVYCSSVVITDGVATEAFPEAVTVTDGRLTLDIAEGTETVYCDWFGVD